MDDFLRDVEPFGQALYVPVLASVFGADLSDIGLGQQVSAVAMPTLAYAVVNVDALRSSEQVRHIHTARVVTRMADVVTFGNRTYEMLVRPSVSEHHDRAARWGREAFAIPEGAVAVLRAVAGELDTAGWHFLNLLKEAILDGPSQRAPSVR